MSEIILEGKVFVKDLFNYYSRRRRLRRNNLKNNIKSVIEGDPSSKLFIVRESLKCIFNYIIDFIIALSLCRFIGIHYAYSLIFACIRLAFVIQQMLNVYQDEVSED